MEHDPRIARSKMRAFAQLSAVTGIIAGLFLLGYYTFGDPFPLVPTGWSWAGFFGNFASVASLIALMPVAFALWVLLPASRTLRVWTVLGGASMALIALSCLLLVLRQIDFQVQGVTFAICIAFVFGWQFVVSQQARRLQPEQDGLLWRWGSALGSIGIAAEVVLASALLLPWGSAAQLLVLTVGGVPSVLSWLALPLWTLALSRDDFAGRAVPLPRGRAAAF
ncbi:hypothetical protein [Salinibacterium sp. ZJ450]|uniref:hypothetical protein n=1 Tax=Salinibacterium sp. ZJ450 TaxID=2708338 RepID=UPI00141F12F0|nr:hypothetical protein [Salinibacterium sp. ZJ450]